MGAGASVNISDVPEVMTESDCRGLAGNHFDEGLFQSVASNGTITKQKLANIISVRTDCFLTHDWGKEFGQDNHARVGLVNAALQKRGLKTWFDAEQMQGNIKKQMVGGIDNTQCVVVFITKRYTEKVSGDNAEDNCQLEFNYAALRKTGARMVAVVMEERMRNTRAWMGEVAMVLGGRLYVDMCGDLSDQAYLDAKADELLATILGVIGTPVNQFGVKLSTLSAQHHAADSTTHQVPKSRDNGPTRSLTSLSVHDVGVLLDNLKLSAFKDELAKNSIDGECLAACETSDDVKECGVGMAVKAKLLFSKVVDFRENGVPEELLVNSQPQDDNQQPEERAEEPPQEAAGEEEEKEVEGVTIVGSSQGEIHDFVVSHQHMTQPRCQSYHDMPYTMTGNKDKYGGQWVCDLCRLESLNNPDTLWAVGRFHCADCQNNLCVSCYDEAGANDCPVDKNEHEMRFTLHYREATNDGYRDGWACDVCQKETQRNPQSEVNGRFCCLECCSDLCCEHRKGERETVELADTLLCSVHPHTLYRNDWGGDNGWACDGRNLDDGCKGGCTDFHQTDGWKRWTCKGCNYDLCELCVQAYVEE